MRLEVNISVVIILSCDGSFKVSTGDTRRRTPGPISHKSDTVQLI